MATMADVMARCEFVWSQGNGTGRGDGYDVAIYRAPSRRYLLRVMNVRTWRERWFLCPTEKDARGLAAAGWTPGDGPGRGLPVDPRRMKDFRGGCKR